MNANKITSLLCRFNSISIKRNFCSQILLRKNLFFANYHNPRDFKFNTTKHYTSALGALTKDQVSNFHLIC